ncbi:bifunctional folylpolyglutamate synthase/dihydrofolate synthase [Desulfobaculum sp. SPO524]|uniref:bifunctional folylpolyglutamate synthase/dihydrofolate synthase n=1 Tax=Desulfobaculum sp. SPO524 TaxID=3378071 RepID=UPI0038543CD0
MGLFHMDLGLERVHSATAALNLLSPSYGVIHVVGTNGKGSTSRTIAELARAHGLRVGLYASPHFITPRERILVDGRMLPPDAWVRSANAAMDAAPPEGLTYFEFLTVLAIHAFDAAGVDLAVMEAGLGGTYDAAGVLRTDLTVYTAIGMDHEAILGPTLADIAADKAGAMRGGTPVVTTPQDDAAMRVLTAHAADVGAPLFRAADVLDYAPETGTIRRAKAHAPSAEGVLPRMKGPHQQRNLHLALAAWHLYAEARDIAITADACRAAAATAMVPGRFQHIPGEPDIYLDGAHNPQALTALAQTLRAEGIQPAAVIFTCLADKDLGTIAPQVRALAPDAPVYVPEMPDNSRARNAAETARAIGAPAHAAPDMASALSRAKSHGGPVLLCGSLYLLAAFFTLHPEHLSDNDHTH